MRKKVFIIALTTLLVVGTISIAFSQGRGRRGRGMGTGLHEKRMVTKAPAELNLTKEQQEKMQSLRIDFQKETLPLRNEMQIKRLELQQLWMADELDEEAIVAKSKEISALRNQLEENMIRHRIAVTKVLTKEQRAKLSLAGRRGRGRRYGNELPGFGRGGRFGMGKGQHWSW